MVGLWWFPTFYPTNSWCFYFPRIYHDSDFLNQGEKSHIPVTFSFSYFTVVFGCVWFGNCLCVGTNEACAMEEAAAWREMWWGVGAVAAPLAAIFWGGCVPFSSHPYQHWGSFFKDIPPPTCRSVLYHGYVRFIHWIQIWTRIVSIPGQLNCAKPQLMGSTVPPHRVTVRIKLDGMDLGWLAQCRDNKEYGIWTLSSSFLINSCG